MKYARKTNIVEVKVLRVIEYQIQQEYQFIGLDMIDENRIDVASSEEWYNATYNMDHSVSVEELNKIMYFYWQHDKTESNTLIQIVGKVWKLHKSCTHSNDMTVSPLASI